MPRRTKATENIQPTTATAPVEQYTAFEIPETVKAEVGKIIGELLMEASDLAYILVEIDDEKIRSTELYQKARTIVKLVKKLREKMQVVRK